MYSKAFTDYVRSKRKRRSALMMVNLHNSRVGREVGVFKLDFKGVCDIYVNLFKKTINFVFFFINYISVNQSYLSLFPS